MMKRLFLMLVTGLMVTLANAQDFVQLFMDEHRDDSAISCITISPKMMQEILKSEIEKNENMVEVISGLKSMQVLSSTTNGEDYYRQALETVKKNSSRYEAYSSFNSNGGDYQIMVRKISGEIVEMIMMSFTNNRFVVINLTGNIKAEFISTLAGSIAKEKL